MAGLYELRQRLMAFYSRYEWLLKFLLKFIHGYLVLFLTGNATGYFALLCSPLVYLGLGFVCALLPASGISVIVSIYLVLQFSKVSLELAAVTACILLIMTLVYFVFKRGNSVLMATALLACLCKGPGVLMVCAGLAVTPAAAIPVGFGILLNALVSISKADYSVLFTQTSTLSSMERVSYVLNQLVQNQYMWLMLICALLVICIVYAMRCRRMNYSWMAAIVSGALLFLVIMLIGSYAFNVKVSITACIINGILAVLIGMILHLFWFAVDYTRTEYVQFEDDDYYYYVKAVPKITVALSNKKVKHITESTGYIAEQVTEDEREE